MATERGLVRVENGSKRVRTYFGGELIADTTAPRLVWETPHYPAYYLPVDAVRMELLAPSGATFHSTSRGDAVLYSLKAGDRTADDAAWMFLESPIEELRDLVRFDWNAMDAWFEEDEEVFVHPRSPYARVDVLDSSRHVRVDVDGVTIAETRNAKILFETGLPARYYIPKPDVRMDLLTPTNTHSGCPYKGFARYWSVDAGGRTNIDLAWSYPTPLRESGKVAGLVCFYNERVDMYVDGVLQERPDTPFA
jgi:uncharacterized protein (DUF427 family)